MILPISNSADSFKKFADEIYDMFSQIDLNKLVPIEEDLRFRIARLIQESIESSSKESEIILTLERQSVDTNIKIDIVIFYIPKDDSPFAEIIELKRGIDDNLGEESLSESNLKEYFYESVKTKFAIDILKIIKRVSTKESIGQGFSNYEKTSPPNVEIRAGFFINLYPTKKFSSKDDSEVVHDYIEEMPFQKELISGIVLLENPL